MPGEAGHRVLPPPGTYFTSDSAKPYPDVPVLWGKGHGDQAEAETPAGAGEGGRQSAESSHGQWEHPRLLETYGLMSLLPPWSVQVPLSCGDLGCLS